MFGGTSRPVSGAGTRTGVGAGVGVGLALGSGAAVGSAVSVGAGVELGGGALVWARDDARGVAVGLPSVVAARAITSADAVTAPMTPRAVFRFNVVASPIVGEPCHRPDPDDPGPGQGLAQDTGGRLGGHRTVSGSQWVSRFRRGHDRLGVMTDRPTSDDLTEGAPTPTPKPKLKVTRARTTVAGKSAIAPKASITAPAVPAVAADPVVAPAATEPAPAASPLALALTGGDIPEVLDVTDGGLDVVRAVRVNVTRGGIDQVEAKQVDVRQGGISRVQATDVAVSMGGIAIARADRMSAEMSGVGVALAGDARISQSFVRALFAREVKIDQGAVWNLAAGKVRFERPSIVGVVIAGRVEGNVKPLLDWRGALALAGVLGLVVAIVRRR